MTYEEKMLQRISAVFHKVKTAKELKIPIVVTHEDSHIIEWALLEYLRYWEGKND